MVSPGIFGCGWPHPGRQGAGAFPDIRRLVEDHVVSVLQTVDDSARKDLLLGSVWAERSVPAAQRDNPVLDRDEAADVADEPPSARALAVLRERLGTEHDHPAQRFAHDPVFVVPAV